MPAPKPMFEIGDLVTTLFANPGRTGVITGITHNDGVRAFYDITWIEQGTPSNWYSEKIIIRVEDVQNYWQK